ncbi:Rootletin [Cercospora beticola]|uniref:Rootletin n=1 Tax=Cercospora beticola TaxID=122368 RepID=A0A2G5HY79_CERBT|nr:Rootletin [Cercospora beticola]PIA97243.1 Rootletin [Cercospora beticola]WPA99172.1 hypothetical protein RHO25_003788 [Cercospora beticola]
MAPTTGQPKAYASKNAGALASTTMQMDFGAWMQADTTASSAKIRDLLANAKRDVLEAEKTKAREEIRRQTAEIKQRLRDKPWLATNATVLDELAAVASEAQVEHVNRLTTTWTKLGDEVQSAQKRHEVRKSEMDDELTDKRRSLVATQQEIARLSGDRDHAKQALADKLKEKEALVEMVAAEQLQLQKAKTEHEGLVKTRQSEERRAHDLAAHIKEQESKVSAVQASLVQAEEESKSQLQAREQELAGLAANKQSLTSTIQEKEEVVQKLKHEHEGLVSQHKKALSALKDEQQGIVAQHEQEMRKRNVQHNELVSNRKKEFDDLQQQHEAQVERHRKRINHLNNEHDKLIAQHKEEATKLRREHEALVQQQQGQTTELKQKHDALVEECRAERARQEALEERKGRLERLVTRVEEQGHDLRMSSGRLQTTKRAAMFLVAIMMLKIRALLRGHDLAHRRQRGRLHASVSISQVLHARVSSLEGDKQALLNDTATLRSQLLDWKDGVRLLQLQLGRAKGMLKAKDASIRSLNRRLIEQDEASVSMVAALSVVLQASYVSLGQHRKLVPIQRQRITRLHNANTSQHQSSANRESVLVQQIQGLQQQVAQAVKESTWRTRKGRIQARKVRALRTKAHQLQGDNQALRSNMHERSLELQSQLDKAKDQVLVARKEASIAEVRLFQADEDLANMASECHELDDEIDKAKHQVLIAEQEALVAEVCHLRADEDLANIASECHELHDEVEELNHAQSSLLSRQSELEDELSSVVLCLIDLTKQARGLISEKNVQIATWSDEAGRWKEAYVLIKADWVEDREYIEDQDLVIEELEEQVAELATEHKDELTSAGILAEAQENHVHKLRADVRNANATVQLTTQQTQALGLLVAEQGIALHLRQQAIDQAAEVNKGLVRSGKRVTYQGRHCRSTAVGMEEVIGTVLKEVLQNMTSMKTKYERRLHQASQRATAKDKTYQDLLARARIEFVQQQRMYEDKIYKLMRRGPAPIAQTAVKRLLLAVAQQLEMEHEEKTRLHVGEFEQELGKLQQTITESKQEVTSYKGLVLKFKKANEEKSAMMRHLADEVPRSIGQYQHEVRSLQRLVLLAKQQSQEQKEKLKELMEVMSRVMG